MIVNTFYRGRIPNARRYLNGMTRICFGLVLMVFVAVSGAPTLGKAQSANIYAVIGVDVDRTSETAAKARQEAIIEAHRLAFDRLMTRLVPADQRTGLPVPPQAKVVEMVLSFGIDEEKTSRVRYLSLIHISEPTRPY